MDIARTALALSAFQVTLHAVPEVDDHGIDCPVCDHEGAVVVAQVYFWCADGDKDLVSACDTCVWDVIKDACHLSDNPVVVELETNAFAHA